MIGVLLILFYLAVTISRSTSLVVHRSSELPIIDLGYVTVQANTTGENNAGIWYVFKNIRYAAPPLGNLRWAAPLDPLPENGINTGLEVNNGTTGGCSVNEDCLFLDVWAPAEAIESGKKLPVLFWNYGGGWAGGTKNDVTPQGLFNISSNGAIFVSYNYRLGMFGILNGPTLQRAGGISNVAIYDARKAMEWVSQHISKFGGDPNQITNAGYSAGAGQVTASLAAFGGNKWKPLYQRAIIHSPGWVPGAGHAQAERFLQNVTKFFPNCPVSAHDTIDCLRNVSFTELSAASQNVTSTWGYQMQPRVDGVVLPDTVEYLASIGQVHKGVDVFLGHNHHEEDFLPECDVTDDASFRAMFKTIFPGITEWAVNEIEDLYPTSEFSSQGYRFALAKQHYDITGRVLPFTNAYGNKTFNYINYLANGVHVSDEPFWWFDPDGTYTLSGDGGPQIVAAPTGNCSSGPSIGSPLPTTNQTWIATRMAQYFASFIISGDPNKLFPSTTQDGWAFIDQWPQYGEGGQVVAFNNSGIHVIDDDLDVNQVKWWNSGFWY